MNDCLFCKIIAGEIPSTHIYEDAFVCAFLDIHPVQPGHTLIVPKVHAETLLEASHESLLGTMQAVQKIGGAIMSGLEVKGFNVFQNNGQVAGQSVFHLHFHIVPRYPDDGLAMSPHGAYASPSEVEAVAERIQGCL